jgi:flagellar FliJ protein
MKQFNFRLQKVLEVREREEQEAIKKLSQAKHATLDAQEKLRELQSSREAIVRSLATERRTGALNPEEQMGYERYIIQLGEKISAQKTLIAELQEIENQRRLELVDAARERKAIENLRERAKLEHDSDVLHAEQSEADDLSSSRDLFKKRAA